MPKKGKPTKFKKYLFEHGIKQIDVAWGTHIMPSSINQIANGHRRPTIVQALKIARFLGVRVEDLFELSEMEEVY